MYSRIGFKRVEELLEVQIEEIEMLLIEMAVDVEIDREEGVMHFHDTTVKPVEDKVREVLKGVADVGYMIYAK